MGADIAIREGSGHVVEVLICPNEIKNWSCFGRGKSRLFQMGENGVQRHWGHGRSKRGGSLLSGLVHLKVSGSPLTREATGGLSTSRVGCEGIMDTSVSRIVRRSIHANAISCAAPHTVATWSRE